MTPLSPATETETVLDVAAVRQRFPILAERVHGKPLVYLDNAATSQKPQPVIDAVSDYYRRYNSNVHRAMHRLSSLATEAYERARVDVARFLGAADARSCIFVRGATEGINLVAAAYARPRLGPGDRVLITHMEHHSNIVPWQLVCEQTGATLDAAPIDDRGELDLVAFERLLERGPKVAAMVWTSNALGTVNPIERMVSAARQAGATTVVDACQVPAHQPIDVAALGCDFLAISGHKMFGPTGIGVLYGRPELLDAMPPYQGGGEMVERVTLEKTTYADVPHRFEAGTPHIAGVVGLGAAVSFLRSLDLDAVQRHEQNLLAYGTDALRRIDGLRLIGTAAHKAPIFSFVLDGVHPYDLAPVLDRQGVAIRTGHHCAQPVMDHFGIAATARASLAMYNTRDEIDTLVDAIRKAKRMLG